MSRPPCFYVGWESLDGQGAVQELASKEFPTIENHPRIVENLRARSELFGQPPRKVSQALLRATCEPETRATGAKSPIPKRWGKPCMKEILSNSGRKTLSHRTQ